MDGTLTVPYFDFDAIRAEIGIVGRTPILEAMELMPEAERRRAAAILDRHERAGAENAHLQEGTLDTLAGLRTRGYCLGLLTRNTRRWVDVVLDRFGIVMDAIRTRDDGPVKPAGDGVSALCVELGADPGVSWMVGDYLFDIIAGRQAGARTVLLIDDREAPPYADQADHVIRRLPELLTLLGPAGKPA